MAKKDPFADDEPQTTDPFAGKVDPFADEHPGFLRRIFGSSPKQLSPEQEQAINALAPESLMGSPEASKGFGTAVGEMAKGVPIAGAWAPQTEGMTELEKQSPGLARIAQGTGGALATAPLTMMAPWAFGLGEGGGLAGAATRAATGATSGAIINATDTAVRGGGLKDIAHSAEIGAAGGGGIPLAGSAISGSVNAIKNMLSPATKTILDNYHPLAVEWAVKAAQESGLSPQNIAQKMEEAGPEGFLGEFSANLRAQMSAAHALPGESKDVISGAFAQRQAGARQRIEDAVTDTLGPRVNIMDRTAENMAQRSTAAKQLYDQWRTEIIPPTAEIEALMPRLKSVNAFGEAQAKAEAEGVPWQDPFMMLSGKPNPNIKMYPTSQTWDYVKRALDSKIEASKNQFGENTDWTRIYTGLKKELMTAIENSNSPGAQIYKQARQAWADPSALMAARREGQKAFLNSTRRDAMQDLFQGYSEPEMHAYREGARDSLAETMDDTMRGNEIATRGQFLTPKNGDKLRMLAQPGSDADEFVSRMFNEKQYRDFESKIIHNSETAQRIAAMGEQTPDPEHTMIARWLKRFEYLPTVSATPYIPLAQAAKKAAGMSQQQRYEAARQSLGPMLVSRGQQAKDIANALATRASPYSYDPTNIGVMLRTLGQPVMQRAGEPQPSQQ
jgi:hypothetical protein